LAVGTICAEPESARDVWSSPRIEGVIETEVAFVLCHVMVAACPEATTAGVMLSEIVGVDPAAATVTVTVVVVLKPFASTAVAVYVVVWLGETWADPVIG